jgi:hypothetical protein
MENLNTSCFLTKLVSMRSGWGKMLLGELYNQFYWGQYSNGFAVTAGGYRLFRQKNNLEKIIG